MTPQPKNLKKRALHVAQIPSDLGTGGIARHVLDLSSWLETQGHKVSFVTTPGEWASPNTYERFVDIPVRFVSADGGSLPNRLISLARSVFGIRRWLAREQVDVIHAHESGPALAARLAVGRRNIPIAVTYHGSHPDRVQSFGRIASKADLVITPSHRAAEDLADRGGVQREKLKVIGLGIKPTPQEDPQKVAQIRSGLLGDGSQLVVSLARLAYQKGIDVLIDVVAKTALSHPHIRFAVVGDGPLENEMKEKAAARGVAGRITFVGRTSHPYTYLRAADLMVLTSRWEALPISIVEAFRVGTPVVATDCSGVHELVDETVGACVPIGDIRAISSAIVKTLDDPDKLIAMSASAINRSAEDRFDPEWVNKRFEETYLELASKLQR